MSGFVRLDRRAFDNPLLRDPARFRAWFWMVAEACWKATKFDIKGKTVTVQRGQFVTSRARLAKEWGWSPSAVERFLTRLETEQMIGRETGQGQSIVTISKYNEFNPIAKKGGQATGQATGQQSDRQRTTKEQGNKGTSNPNGLRPDGVSDEVWNDFVLHRKRKRADITQTAMNGIKSQAEKAGWPIGEAIAEIVQRGWTGFKADWVEKREQSQAPQPKKSPQEWLEYCESMVKKCREKNYRTGIERWEAEASKARDKIGIPIPKLKVVS